MIKTTDILLVIMLLANPLVAQVLEGTSNPVHIEMRSSVQGGEDVRLVSRTVSYEDLGISYLPRYYGLIIGVSDYAYGGPGLVNLDKPVMDAEDLYNVLISHYAFSPETTTLLKNPTRENMIDAFDALIRKVTDKDNVLIFYAGHGYHDKESGFGFWLPSDAKRKSRSAWMANSQIRDYMGAMKSKHTLLISDACFSGSIFKTRRVDAMDRAMRIHETYRDKSRKAMTSGNLTEVPDESFFVKYLLKALRENEEVYMTSTNLFTRIYEPVINNTANTPQFGVVQGVGDEGGDFIFFKKM